METKHAAAAPSAKAPCTEVPELKRLNYFYGQMLGVSDFQAEQAYFRDKLKLHNRCLHGYGTVCGLVVSAEEQAKECEPEADTQRTRLQAELTPLEEQKREAAQKGDAQRIRELDARIEAIRQELERLPPAGKREAPANRLIVDCGLALDCHGNEIVVRRPQPLDPWTELSQRERRRVEQHSDGSTLYLSICYCEQPVDPVRPVLVDACGAVAECTYGKLRDAFKLRVSTEPPPEDRRCEPCCQPCEEPCLLLAVIRGYRRDKPISDAMIDNAVRRRIGTYAPTTITGISWTHNAEYTQDEAHRILGTDPSSQGLKVTFSRPVLVSSLTRGVVDIWVVQGGATRRGDIYALEGEFVGLTGTTTQEFRYQYTGDETLDPGDRVLITIRGPFILDECCLPLAGLHVGGRVPILPDEEFKPFDRTPRWERCAEPRLHGYGPWASGGGAGNFESWFFVERGQTKPGAFRRRP